jgi:hypothetical protein
VFPVRTLQVEGVPILEENLNPRKSEDSSKSLFRDKTALLRDAF